MKIREKGEKGQAIVEFALVLPILLLIVGGIIEFGIMFYNKQVITNASREGARAGIVYDPLGTPPKNIQETVAAYCQDRLITFGPVNPVIVDPETSGSLSRFEDLTVSVSYQYKMFFSSMLDLFGADLGPQITIQTQTVMRME